MHAYVKNQGLGFEEPYLLGATPKKYLPDFIVQVEDGRGDDDLLNLVVEGQGLSRRGRQGQGEYDGRLLGARGE